MKTIIIYLLLNCFIFVAEAKEIFPPFPPTAARDFPYDSPTERYIGYFGWQTISTGLRNQGVTLVHHNLFDRISHREAAGFIGYHGSTQTFRIYQDIIRLILEEHLELFIRDDFHFFRIPGDQRYQYTSLAEWGIRGYDPTHFVCMNYAIYGNHINHFSSSYYYFTVNGSLNSLNYQALLQPLFDRLGMDRQKILDLFHTAYREIGFENGVIYQFFDSSHYDPTKPYYALADKQCLNYGNALSFSEMVKGIQATPFANQIRMLMNNRYTLNPYESLIVKRFDKLPPETMERYMNVLRMEVKSLTHSDEHCKLYRKELFQLWGQDE